MYPQQAAYKYRSVFHCSKSFKIKQSSFSYQLLEQSITCRRVVTKMDPIVSLFPFRLFIPTISSISKMQEGKNVEINYARIRLGRQICLWYLKRRYCCWLLTTAEQKWFNLIPNPMSGEGSSKDWRSHDSLLYIQVTLYWNVIQTAFRKTGTNVSEESDFQTFRVVENIAVQNTAEAIYQTTKWFI
jgi:hypothetical protein